MSCGFWDGRLSIFKATLSETSAFGREADPPWEQGEIGSRRIVRLVRRPQSVLLPFAGRVAKVVEI